MSTTSATPSTHVEETPDLGVFFAGMALTVVLGTVVLLLLYRIILSSVRSTRALSCMESEKQNYWSEPTKWFASIKQHIIYAPLFGTRHHSEIWLSKGWSVGVLPTRFQSLLLTGLIAFNILFCFQDIPWNRTGTKTMLTLLRNRAGDLAVANMIPLVIFAGRNNPLITLLNVPYDSFNLMHRWLGRIVAAEAVIHVVAHCARTVPIKGWSGIAATINRFGSVSQTGVIAMAGFVVIIITAMTIFRRAFYEFWLHLHILLVVMCVVALYYHLEDLPAQNFITATFVAWAIERFVRLLITFYRNIGSGGTRALVEVLPGNAVKVTLSIARPWTFRPGQHMYIMIPSIGLWTNHPFSLAWSDSEVPTALFKTCDPEKGSPVSGPPETTEKGLEAGVHNMSRAQSSTFSSNAKPSMTAIIRCADGFTKRLRNRVRASPDGRFSARAFVEGPYGGHQSLASYGTVVLVAGGVGITHQVPYLRSLLEGHAQSAVACRRLLLVWAIQSPEHLEWIRPWMTQVLAMESRRQILRIQLYVTRPRTPEDIHSPSATVQMFSGRPNVDAIVENEAREQIGAMAVSVCGPGSLADEVRNATRKRQSEKSMDFIEEAFSW